MESRSHWTEGGKNQINWIECACERVVAASIFCQQTTDHIGKHVFATQLWSVVEALPVVVEYVQPDPVIEYAAPASAVTYAALAPVIECIAPAPAVEATHLVSQEHVQQYAVEQIVDAAPARVIEHAAPMPLDVYEATLMGILDDFHQAMKQIPDLPPRPSTLEQSASVSSACAAPIPVDDWVGAAEEPVKQEELETKPVAKKKGKHKRWSMDGVRDGNRMPGAV